jgi:hypothetical protein
MCVDVLEVCSMDMCWCEQHEFLSEYLQWVWSRMLTDVSTL